MKLTIQTADISALLSLALNVAKSGDPVRIIAERIGENLAAGEVDFAELAPEPGYLRIIAFNDTSVCEWRKPAEIAAPGSAAIDAGMLDKFVKASLKSDGTLAIATRDTDNARALRIGTARGSHEFECLPETLFQTVIPGRAPGEPANLANLARALTVAQVASAGENEAMGARIALTGVHLRPRDGTIDVVGTDGRRLAIARLRDDDTESVDIAAIPDGATIPARLIATLAKIMSEAPAKIAFDGANLVIENADGSLSTRLIDAAYPDYSRLLSIPARESITLDTGMLATALARSSAAIGRDERLTGAEIVRDDTGVYLVSRTNHQSSSERIEEAGGEKATIGFDIRYMTAALKPFSTRKITLRFQDAQTPIFVGSDERPDVTMIVMPMRL